MNERSSSTARLRQKCKSPGRDLTKPALNNSSVPETSIHDISIRDSSTTHDVSMEEPPAENPKTHITQDTALVTASTTMLVEPPGICARLAQMCVQLAHVCLWLALVCTLVWLSVDSLDRRCEELRVADVPLDEMRSELGEVVLGQPAAMNAVGEALERWLAKDSPHTLWLWGHIGVGKTLTVTTLSHALGEHVNFVTTVSEFLQPPRLMSNLVDEHLNLLSHCNKNILVIDSWDNATDGTINFIEKFMEAHAQSSHAGNKLLLLLSGTAGLNYTKHGDTVLSSHAETLVPYQRLKAISGEVSVAPFGTLPLPALEGCMRRALRRVAGRGVALPPPLTANLTRLSLDAHEAGRFGELRYSRGCKNFFSYLMQNKVIN